uniref:WD_REPEATS_REGION domain-containing protein n=1 Tax=Globodera pallida TaxID=36090 RepID=A0A183BZ19_GLOPA
MTSNTEPKIVPIQIEKPSAIPSKPQLQIDDANCKMETEHVRKQNGEIEVDGSNRKANGQAPIGAYIASGDADGFLYVWKLEQQSVAESEVQVMEGVTEERKRGGDPEMDIPPNKETWVRAFRSPIRHDGDVTGLCWSPDSQMLASVSMDDSVAVHRADSGKRVWAVRNFRHFANGIVWDPRGKYLVAMSTDRRMDVLDAMKGTRLRCCHQIELPTTPLRRFDGTEIHQKLYKVFHDDQLFAFQRGVEFSPCGSVVLAPAVHLEVAALNVYGVFAFLRSDLDLCRPAALFQSAKPAIQAKCSPILYRLAHGPNFLGLSHRLIFAVLCRDSVLLYSSQNEFPLAYIENLQYDKLTSMAWTPDGRVLVVSSMEGFNSFITVDLAKLGIPSDQQSAIAFVGDDTPMSPLYKAKKQIRKRCTEKQ